MSVQKIVGLIMAPLCLLLLISNPISRIISGENLFRWEDILMIIFLGMFSISIFLESNILKFLHVFSFFLAGTMVFLIPDHNILSFFLGFMIIYKALELSFAYGFFRKKIVPKIIFVAIIFWALIYIGIKNLLDSIMWSILLDAMAGVSFLIHFDLIRKARKLDEQEKKEIVEDSLIILEELRKREKQDAPTK